jgi:acyl-coenzyme A synthetase/AMP-(fatty) acid ligase
MTLRAILDTAVAAPSRAALIFNDRAFSYGDFAAAIGAAQGAIVGYSVTAPGVVILAMGNLLDAWIFGLASRGLGLTTLIVRSIDEFDAIALADVRCVFATAVGPWTGLEGACAGKGWRLVVFGGDGVAPAPAPPTFAANPGGHILRTSGTTGAYKMVLLDPAREAVEARRRMALFELTADSRVALADFGGWTGIGYKSASATWLAGGAVVINQERELRLALTCESLTHAHLIPQMLSEILAAPDGVAARSEALRVIVTGGPITQALADEVKARIAPRLFNSVAATEATIFAYTALESPEDRRWHRPAPGVALGVVDERDRPAPSSQIGRLRIATAGGPAGYLGDAGASAEFFKPGWFYPGDLAVMRPDGRFALHGRLTEVINVGGHKIGPAPLEDALREALGVTAVCLISMQDEAAEEQLHLAIEASTPLDMTLVAKVLRKQMAGFEAVHVHQLHDFPRNELGKVQRAAVHAMVTGSAEG